jgi:hypothetical protein
VRNNPFNLVDPLGLCKLTKEEELWEKVNKLDSLSNLTMVQQKELQELLKELENYEALQNPDPGKDPIDLFVFAVSGWGKGPWMGTMGPHPPHHGSGKHFEIILRWVGGKLKIFIPGKKGELIKMIID